MPDVIVALIVAAILALGLWPALGAVLGRPRGRWRTAARVVAVGAVALFLSASMAFFVSRAVGFQLLGDHVARVETSERVVALTFDDGPTPAHTKEVVRVLRGQDVRATFFVTGGESEASPAELRRLVVAGHEIGNHSYSHRNLTDLSELEIERELVMTRQIVRRACGRFITLFRPPGGHYNASVRAATRATGFSPLFWNENIGNYPGRGPDEIVPSMIRKVGSSGIVLLHNGYDETPAMLPAFLKELSSRGYRMGTVSELCSHSPFVMAEAPAPGPPGWQLH